MYEIISLTKESPQGYFDQVKSQFVRLYEHMAELGLYLNLAPKGETIWLNSIKGSLARLNEIVVAIEDNRVLAFGAATIRFMPAYLGNKKIGYLTHLFIEPDVRLSGLGSEMMLKMEHWCFRLNVDSIETERLCENKKVKDFHKKLGYVEEQIKSRKVRK